MQPEVAATYGSPKATLTGADASARLRLSMQAGPVWLMRRLLDESIARAIDTMVPAALPTLDASGSVNRVRQEIEVVFASSDNGALPAMVWLRQDVLDLAALFAAAASVERLRVHLQLVEDDMCSRFHVDNVAFRLVTTYRGPGTEWVSPRAVDETTPGGPLPSSAIRRMDRGTVAVLRGGRNATVERSGVLHRSPPIEGTGTVRLLLAISDVDGDVAVGRA